MRRVLAVLAGATLLVLGGCGSKALKELPLALPARQAPADPARAFGPIEQQLTADLDGDGTAELVALSPVIDRHRTLGILRQGKDGFLLLASARVFPETSAMQVEELGGQRLIILRHLKDGAPQYQAFAFTGGVVGLIDYYSLAAPQPDVTQGWFVMISKRLNALWVYRDGRLVRAYRVATGRQTEGPAPGWDDYRTNFSTPEGRFTLATFAKDPPFNALKPGDLSYPGGHPENPLGTRWMGFPVLHGDNGWLWGIHGTNEPERIGTWASDGCIRMLTAEAEELFALIPEGTPLTVTAK
jgi:hypothetical protein